MRISDWSSDVCSSDLTPDRLDLVAQEQHGNAQQDRRCAGHPDDEDIGAAGEHPVLRGDDGHQAVGQLHVNGDIAVIELGVDQEIDRAAGRERVCEYVENSVVAGAIKKTKKKKL